jgi:hypothetical protein
MADYRTKNGEYYIEVGIVTKMVARARTSRCTKDHMRRIITYKEWVNFVLKSYHELGSAVVKGPDVAMVFFRGLYNAYKV